MKNTLEEAGAMVASEIEDAKNAPPKQYGWICPACGCGNAPYSTRCGHCVPRVEGTTGSTK